MSETRSRLLSWIGLIARAALVVGCLVYAVWGLEPSSLLNAFGRLSPWKILLAFGVASLQYIPLAWRFDYLGAGQVGYIKAWNASLLCLGVNNLLPARLGEVAKAAYLRQAAGVTLGRGLIMVFWERLFDLMSLLALALAAAGMIGHPQVLLPLGLLILGLWAGVLTARFAPRLVNWMLGFVPFERLRLFLRELAAHLQEPHGPGFFAFLTLSSAVIWLSYYAVFYVILDPVVGLSLKPAEIMAVFAISGLGYAIPSSPGALGVFEAAAVWGMSLFGVSREEALVGALMIRATQYIPTVLYTLWLMARSGLSLSSLRTAPQGD